MPPSISKRRLVPPMVASASATAHRTSFLLWAVAADSAFSLSETSPDSHSPSSDPSAAALPAEPAERGRPPARLQADAGRGHDSSLCVFRVEPAHPWRLHPPHALGDALRPPGALRSRGLDQSESDTGWRGALGGKGSAARGERPRALVHARRTLYSPPGGLADDADCPCRFPAAPGRVLRCQSGHGPAAEELPPGAGRRADRQERFTPETRTGRFPEPRPRASAA